MRFLTLLLSVIILGCATQDGVLKQTDPGTIVITEQGDHSALVFIDQVLLDTVIDGNATLTEITAGDHEITLWGSGTELFTTDVVVLPNEELAVLVELSDATTGTIQISGDPEATVTLNNLSFGAIGNTGEILLDGFPIGEYPLRIQNGSKLFDTTISLAEDDTVNLSSQLTYQQTVLVEYVSNVSCEYCPDHAEVLYHILDSLEWNGVTKISYNANWPATDDPLYLFDAQPQLERAMLYGAEVNYALPIFVVNGTTLTFDANNDTLYAKLVEMIASEQSKTPTFDIALTDTSVEITALGIESFSGNIRVNLVQDLVQFETAPGSNGEVEFKNAFRHLVLDESINITDQTPETLSFSIDYTGLSKSGLRLNAFLQDDDNAIIQTVEYQL